MNVHDDAERGMATMFAKIAYEHAQRCYAGMADGVEEWADVWSEFPAYDGKLFPPTNWCEA